MAGRAGAAHVCRRRVRRDGATGRTAACLAARDPAGAGPQTGDRGTGRSAGAAACRARVAAREGRSKRGWPRADRRRRRAERLYCHRNPALNRIHRLERLTGRRPTDPADLVELSLAMTAVRQHR
ncbi:helix-turn-helix domain-containing protein [Streptomyces sp. NPDC006463]|uniref:helix-turn-helix domain-containing protein n=1 Tax=Streptomyces sp. NPDC006463 TaxID=3364746 RepID=UPI003699B9DB